MKKVIGMAIMAACGIASAATMPSGIQTNVSQAQVSNWGWTECSRTGATQAVSMATVLSACQGSYLAMGVWDASANAYGVVGMGEWDVVSKILYADHTGDDRGTTQNWSNGLNWYRTATYGSWGFTTAKETALNTADTNLYNGLNNPYSTGTVETTLAAGLSFHVNNGNLTSGWAFNATGLNHTDMTPSDQRVFWVANVAAVPEPTSIALFGLGALALMRRRSRK